jgi:Na+/melibiose symporter-like transporter
MGSVIRASSADQPDDPRRGRAGWGAGRRGRPPAQGQQRGQQGNQPVDQQRQPNGQQGGNDRHETVPTARPAQPPRRPEPPQRRSEPPPRREPPVWQAPPPRQQRTTYRPDGYPPEDGHRSGPGPQPGRNEFVPPEAPRAGNQSPKAGTPPPPPKKLTVTRVAAYRGRQLGQQAVGAFRRAAQADGAHESGLTSLTYAVMLNYASSAAMAVGLANTLFFSAATAESKTKVALYLVITVAPFALIAPVVGPLLDRIQRGRRIALAVSCVGQGLLSVVMALHLNDWMLYPAALGTLVLSKSFDVLKSSMTPRVVPAGITLSKTNARLTVFGLAAGMVFGGVAGGFAKVFGSPGALWFTAVLCIGDAVLCLGIPAWVEVTEGEVPTSLRAEPKRKRQPMGRHVVIGLWGNGTIRVMTGFLLLFPAFVIKTMEEHSPTKQLLLLGLVGAAAGLGSFVGNAIGARLQFRKPDQVVLMCLLGCVGGGALAAVTANVTFAAIAALIASVGSALAKVSLDASIQNDLPEASRASAFGRSETILQLSWVLGGAMGVLLPTRFGVGFSVVTAVLVVGAVQTALLGRGRSMASALGGWRPTRPNVTFRTRDHTEADPGEAQTKRATRVMPTEQPERPYGPPASSGDRTS